ncbi:MAG TPA: transposase [Armatimonadota bacterium]|nr:transposase [Armatimonadota bacterium]
MGMPEIWHVNFHTFHNLPVLEPPECDRCVRDALAEIIAIHNIKCLGWELMPTHCHALSISFSDMSLGRIMQLPKGGSSKAFFGRFPEHRFDLGGGHLWGSSHSKVLIATNIQLDRTPAYIRRNRVRADL